MAVTVKSPVGFSSDAGAGAAVGSLCSAGALISSALSGENGMARIPAMNKPAKYVFLNLFENFMTFSPYDSKALTVLPVYLSLFFAWAALANDAL
jgi:hypothetical protein